MHLSILSTITVGSSRLYKHNPVIETSDNAYFVVPDKAENDIHIILEVTDDGTPALIRYKRLVFKVE